MEIEVDNGTPAGGADDVQSSMTLDAAVSLMSEWPDEGETTQTPEPETTQATTETVDDGQSLEAEGVEGEETAPEHETQPEDGAIDWEKVPGTAKFRLRDGTEVTAADLKRDYDALRTARQTEELVKAEKAKFEQFQSRVAQEAELFAKVAPRAIAALKASIPEVPPYPSRELLSDPIAYQEALDAHNRAMQQRNEKIVEIQQIQQAEAYRMQQAKAKEEEEFQNYLLKERDALMEKLPELKDPAKLETFNRELMEYGSRHYGFEPQEMSRIVDHRVVRVIKDAIAFRKLQANPPKPVASQPATKQAPVAAPKPRPSEQSQKVQQIEQMKQRAQKSGGNIRDVAAIIAQLD